MHVYVITNTINDKIYIGQHSGTNLLSYLNRRCNMALRDERYSPIFCRAVRKYGKAAFTIRSLVNPIDKQQMDALEMFFIRTLDSRNSKIGYNITAGGGGALGVTGRHTNHSKHTRQRMSISARERLQTPEGQQHHRLIKELSLAAIRGKKKTFANPELRIQRIKESLTGRTESLEHRQRIGESLLRTEQLRRDNSSGVKGVSWAKNETKWRAYLTRNKRQVCLGYFTNKGDAIAARKEAEKRLWQQQHNLTQQAA